MHSTDFQSLCLVVCTAVHNIFKKIVRFPSKFIYISDNNYGKKPTIDDESYKHFKLHTRAHLKALL